MAANLKPRITPDAATAELWRVAESGDVAELARILPRVGNVNARNHHGMTALMRAAYHGHAPMVQALLDHGADPNLTRNDKFTALALAAFFGHTETVRTLIDHGAKPEVVTRCGASARVWATARTFNEVARCLEAHTPAKAPAVVKTLKDPPEIWDLVQVQEVPKSFNARSAFVSRLQSMGGSFALRAAAAVLVAAGCAVGVWALRGSQARSLQAEVVATPMETKVVPAETVQTPSSETPVSAPATEVTEAPAVDPVRNHGTRKVRWRESPARPSVVEDIVENAPSKEPPVAKPAVSSPPQTESRSSNKVNTALSPQLITPAKSSAPKAKVIQWP